MLKSHGAGVDHNILDAGNRAARDQVVEPAAQALPERGHGSRRSERITIGGVSHSPSAGGPPVLRATRMPFTTPPKAAQPPPSGVRLPPQSGAGSSPLQE